jgi:hypothetical protein
MIKYCRIRRFHFASPVLLVIRHHHFLLLDPLHVYIDCTVCMVYHRERILETSTLSCNEEEEEITKPPKR